jgi:hypothetical protein
LGFDGGRGDGLVGELAGQLGDDVLEVGALRHVGSIARVIVGILGFCVRGDLYSHELQNAADG